jgi:hypothetical protein
MTDSSGGQFVPIHGADDPSGFGSREATATRVINPSTVAYDLISIRCLAEMEDRVLEILRDATVACWIALYRSVDGAYHRRRVQGIGEDALPDRLDPDATSRLLDEGFDITVEECAQLDDRFPGPIGCIRMQAEFDLLPSFVIVGRSAGAGGPLQTDLQTIVEVCAIALHNAELVERLQAEVFIDYLTKCYNRRAFEEHLAVEMVRARRYERSLCLLLLDLDNFKRVNDAQGHPQGDYVLRKLGEMLRGAFWPTGCVGRSRMHSRTRSSRRALPRASALPAIRVTPHGRMTSFVPRTGLSTALRRRGGTAWSDCERPRGVGNGTCASIKTRWWKR